MGVLITIADAYLEGKWRTKHTIDASMGIIGAVFPVVGVIWFGANLISLANNGKTISENIQQYEDNLKEFDFTNVPLSFGRF